MTQRRVAAVLGFLVLCFATACVHTGKSRPVDVQLQRAIRFLEIDDRGVDRDLSSTGLANDQLLDGGADATRVPDPALVDVDSTIQVRVDRDRLKRVDQAAVLGEARSKELLERKHALEAAIVHLQRSVELRRVAIEAWTSLERAKREGTGVEEARRRFREARGTFGTEERAAIGKLREAWRGDLEIEARIDAEGVADDDRKLIALVQDLLREVDGEHVAIELRLREHVFHLRLTAMLVSGSTRTPLHLPGYDDLDDGDVVRRDRTGLDLPPDERKRLEEQWRSTVAIAEAVEGLRRDKKKLRDVLFTAASLAAPEVGRALAAAEEVVASLRELDPATSLPQTARDVAALAAKARDATARLGAETARQIEERLKQLAGELEQLARLHEVLVEARELGEAWRRARPDELVDLLARTTAMRQRLPALLAAVETTFRERGGAELADLLAGFDAAAATAVQSLLDAPETARLTERLAQARRVWTASRAFFATLEGVLSDLQQPKVPDDLEAPHALRVPLEDVRDTRIDLTRTNRRDGDRIVFSAELLRSDREQPVEELEASFVPYTFGWSAELSPAVVLLRPTKLAARDETFAFAPTLSWLHGYLPRPEETDVLASLARFLRPGIGPHAAFLNVDPDEEVEIGLGLTLSLWDKRLQFGGGVNLMGEDEDDGRYYVFVGSDLISLLNTIGIGNGK